MNKYTIAIGGMGYWNVRKHSGICGKGAKTSGKRETNKSLNNVLYVKLVI